MAEILFPLIRWVKAQYELCVGDVTYFGDVIDAAGRKLV
jgi:hypothetical protein